MFFKFCYYQYQILYFHFSYFCAEFDYHQNPIKMIENEGRQFSDEEILAEYRKRSDEYLEWRQQKAAEFLQNKKRDKCYHCYTVETETSFEDDFYLELDDDIIARVQALKERIAHDPEMTDDDMREDELLNGIEEIGYDIKNVPQPWPSDNVFTNIDLDDYLHFYRFDIHLLDWNEDGNCRQFPASVNLSDEEYIDLLAFLLDQPDCSFHHLAHLSPKLKAIYEKVSRYLDNYEFGMLTPFCHTHDYAIRMTEIHNDAKTLLKQLKKKKEKYPYIGFLKDFVVNLSVCVSERKSGSSSQQSATGGSPTTGTAAVSQQDQLAELANLIDQFARGDNFLAVKMLKSELKRRINEDKLTVPCPIQVKNDQIYLKIPGIGEEELSFERANVAKALYILLLRQIERADKDKTVSRYLSQNEMRTYSAELHKIYEYISRKKKSNLTLFEKSTISNDFQTAKNSIKNCFEQYFNFDEIKKFGKCYCIEKKGKDSQGNPRYGIELDVDDFDLGYYSIYRTQF